MIYSLYDVILKEIINKFVLKCVNFFMIRYFIRFKLIISFFVLFVDGVFLKNNNGLGVVIFYSCDIYLRYI